MPKENSGSPKLTCIIQTIIPPSRTSLDQKNQYLNQLIRIQYQVNQQLILNSFLTQKFIKSIDESTGKNSSSEGSTLPGNCQKQENNSQFQYENQGRIKKASNGRARKSKQGSESEYEPSQSEQIVTHHKLSESKNVPKNFSKSILSFIKRNANYIKNVLQKYEINQQSFERYVGQFKNSINTIAELRGIWIKSKNNPFAQVLRIISNQYLKKHCLSHIFNSRVENYAKHIKYRQKIIKAIEKPEQFTQMKDF